MSDDKELDAQIDLLEVTVLALLQKLPHLLSLRIIHFESESGEVICRRSVGPVWSLASDPAYVTCTLCQEWLKDPPDEMGSWP